MRYTKKHKLQTEQGLPQEQKERRKNAGMIILIVIFAAVFLFSVVSLVRYYDASGSAETEIEVLRGKLPSATPRPSVTPRLTSVATPSSVTQEETFEPEPTERVYEISERFESLYAINSDLVGWVTIEDTNIDYPVMLSPEDGEFYMNHNFEKERESRGIPFLDERCEIAPKSQIQIIYGHNIRSGIMFHDLVLYQDEEFWKEHQYIIYDTLYDEAVYQIVAAFAFEAWNLKAKSFQFNRYTEFIAGIATEKRFSTYKENVLELAFYDTGVDFDYDDQYLILATCEYTMKNGRFVLLAKQVQ